MTRKKKLFYAIAGLGLTCNSNAGSVIIAGSRDCNTEQHYRLMELMLPRLINMKRISEVVSGAAEGADTLGEKWADEYRSTDFPFGIPVIRFPVKKADWRKYGKSAGPRRNATMARYAKARGDGPQLIVCWDGQSRGTKSMIREAEKQEIPIGYIRYKKGR